MERKSRRPGAGIINGNARHPGGRGRPAARSEGSPDAEAGKRTAVEALSKMAGASFGLTNGARVPDSVRCPNGIQGGATAKAACAY